MAKIEKAEAIKKLERQRERLAGLPVDTGSAEFRNAEFSKWKRDTEVAIQYIFGAGATRHANDFNKILWSPRSVSSNTDLTRAKREAFLKARQAADAVLKSMIDEIADYWRATPVSTAEQNPVKTPSREVFIVHGRNDACREMVARYLEKLKLKPIILHEQPNKGRTIIEKFLDYGNVSFAVVLLTADDQGGLKDMPFANQQLRARQNVILELGFFLGSLGRDRVCALYENGVEIPSDYDGVIFLPFDAGGAWRMSLAREIKQAGLPIDMNDAI